MIINKKKKKNGEKKTCRLVDFVVPSNHRVKNERKQKGRQEIYSCHRIEIIVKNEEVTVILVVVGALGTVLKGLERELRTLEIRRIIETTVLLTSVLNTQKSPGDLRELQC